MFPFARFPGVDTVLGPEMRSTGEVMGLARDFALAFAKSQLGAGTKVPLGGAVFVSVRDADKPGIVEPLKALAELGFKIVATGGTQKFLAAHGVAATKVNKVSEGRPHVADAMRNGGVQLVFNTTEGATSLNDSKPLRRAALLQKTPYYTTLAGAIAAVEGIKAVLRAILKFGRCRTISPELSGARAPALLFDSSSGTRDMDRFPVTVAGHAALEAELKHRQQVERPRIVQAIAEARAHGDLSENAEYHSAKEAQSHNEGRIVELEDMLAARRGDRRLRSSPARRSSSAPRSRWSTRTPRSRRRSRSSARPRPT